MARPKRKTLPKDFGDLLAAGDFNALKAVFDVCEVDARGGVFKQTALAFASCPDALTDWLVAHGADLSAPDSYGETPLHSRAGHWQGDVAPLIASGADVNNDAGGRGTPLHRAARSGNVRAAEALLAHGARADATNKGGDTPLVVTLRHCSNASIERATPMADLLLGTMSGVAEAPRSLVGRLFGGSARQPSPVTPEMQDLVRGIGANFEFHRAGFNPESVDATSAALDRLYALFDVAPVPHRALHDGTAPIVATAGRWEDQHQQLWEMLVPSNGPAATIQGEVIRISGRVTDEIGRNGGANWDRDYRRMADAFLAHVGAADPLDAPELERARCAVADIKGGDGEGAVLCELAVQWVARNPQPIPLPAPDYAR